MRPFVKWNIVIFALAAGLACATGAYADSLSWSMTGTDVATGTPLYGSGVLTATNEGGGVYDVTGMTGNITIDGVEEAITGLTPYTGTEPDPSGLYDFDNVVTLPNTPVVDTLGLVFTLNGYGPVNVCSGAAAGCESAGTQVWLDTNPTSVLGDPVTFTATVPEPSAIGLLILGLLGLMMLGLGRERLQTASSN